MRRPLAAVGVVAALAGVAALVTVLLHPGVLPRPQARHAVGGPTPSATATPTGERLVPGTLLIPKIGVDAPIEQLSVDGNGDMAAPRKPTEVGWYAPGVVPGQAGDAVIDGHLDWYGVPHAVFYRLDQLVAGDEVDVIDQHGRRLRFQVTTSTTVPRTAHPAGLFAATGPPRLTLITCDGTWDRSAGQYSHRLLVNASYTGPS